MNGWADGWDQGVVSSATILGRSTNPTLQYRWCWFWAGYRQTKHLLSASQDETNAGRLKEGISGKSCGKWEGLMLRQDALIEALALALVQISQVEFPHYGGMCRMCASK